MLEFMTGLPVPGAGSRSDARVDVGIGVLHVIRGRILLRGGEAST